MTEQEYTEITARAKRHHEGIIITHAAQLELDPIFQRMSDWGKAKILRQKFSGVNKVYGLEIAELMGIDYYA